jgi:hypothetical protein
MPKNIVWNWPPGVNFIKLFLVSFMPQWCYLGQNFMEYADSGINYAEKYCMKLAYRCQIHKTFSGVIYAPSGVTLVKMSWNMPIAA